MQESTGLCRDALRRAVDIYLGLAYPSGTVPEAVRRRLEWPETDRVEDLVARPPFEKAGKARDTNAPIFALRLGNAKYPHMKLQLQSWPSASGFLLSVNTHDQVLGLDPHAADAAAFQELQAENQRIKESIELAWDADGLPTFLRYLRDYIREHPTPERG